MLERKGHSDILSAPKITTQAGQEAVIKVVTEYLYPTEFTVTPLQATDNLGVSRIIGGIVEPSGFEMREVGVILVVIPDVAEDGSMINLSMTPEVVSEPTWMQYGSEYTVQEVTQILPMPQPFFHTRSLQTTISVYNGATVAMGGMITELRNSVDERIPFLGDIPLIGRLFRNQYEESIKRNLMIFVTAKLVDPAGRVVKQQTGETYVTKVGTQE